MSHSATQRLKGQDSEQRVHVTTVSRHLVNGKQFALFSEGTAVVGGLRAGWAAEAACQVALAHAPLKTGLGSF